MEYIGDTDRLSVMCNFSCVALINFNPNKPSGAFGASKACSVTIHTYPAPVIFRTAASLKITVASVFL